MNKVTKTNTSYCNVKVKRKILCKLFFFPQLSVVLPFMDTSYLFQLTSEFFKKSSSWPSTSLQEHIKPILFKYRTKPLPLHILVQYLASYQSGTYTKTELLHVTKEAGDSKINSCRSSKSRGANNSKGNNKDC